MRKRRTSEKNLKLKKRSFLFSEISFVEDVNCRKTWHFGIVNYVVDSPPLNKQKKCWTNVRRKLNEWMKCIVSAQWCYRNCDHFHRILAQTNCRQNYVMHLLWNMAAVGSARGGRGRIKHNVKNWSIDFADIAVVCHRQTNRSTENAICT